MNFPSFSFSADSASLRLQRQSLVIGNDAVFSDADFNHIRTLDQSRWGGGLGSFVLQLSSLTFEFPRSKSNDPFKTGKFGVGFNICYHYTDLPSFMSRDQLCIFDASSSLLPNNSTSPQP